MKRLLFILITITITMIVSLIVENYRHKDLIVDKRTIVKLPIEKMEIMIPTNKSFENYWSNTNSKYKYVIYTDSLTCSPCEFKKISRWCKFIEKAVETNTDIDFIFIYHPTPNNISRLKEAYKHTRFIYPIYIDSIGIFEKENEFLKNGLSTHAFLLKNNTIDFFGDPTKNLKLEYRLFNYYNK